ncbi:flagellar basal body P-ring formation chaperone FlgA [Vibrio sp. TRT 1302]|uniref:flagellar basal body P-ring formation chaperone FlgA n=1 Tax=Vibrio sp. TRT 1302 TaxID=3418504 RepID=UPI003CF4A2A3
MIYKKERKSNFRFTEVTKWMRNRFTSPYATTLMATLILIAPKVSGAEDLMTEQALKRAVSEQFLHQISLIAEQKQWQNYHLATDIRVPSAVNHLPTCPNALIIEAGDSNILPIGNLKRSVSCQSATVDWRINVTIKSALTLNVVVAKTAINRDESITSSQLALEQRTLNREQDFYTQLDQVNSKIATRRIRSGQIVDGRKLQSPALVEKGNQVVITATKDGFSASTKGVALEQGAYGQQIDVRNSSSGKEIKAVVTGINQVETQF